MSDKLDLGALAEARQYVRWVKRMRLTYRVESAAKPEVEVPIKQTKVESVTEMAKPRAANVPSKIVKPEWEGRPEFAALAQRVDACRKCALGATRTNAVFGVGDPNADLVFIGEAPGANEDASGVPFVGNAGNLLTRELAKNGVSRDEVFICNILKCRPPNNRDPLPEEIMACEPHLLEQLKLLKPKFLCGLGRHAIQTLLKHEVKIMKIRGQWETYNNLPLFVCLHPAAVLHQPQNRALFEADIAALAKAYHGRDRGGA
ncbi:MAG: uracil-DNA glycosylase [Candidatus Sumerlaeaceae bacterium]|nr:uracil-DNA glycosylase [Candidatus Sumerlaeaceae bacterium]